MNNSQLHGGVTRNCLDMASNNNGHLQIDTTIEVKNTMQSVSPENKTSHARPDKFYSIVFLSAVTGISALIGFGSTLAAVKKKDPKFFQEGIIGVKGVADSGASLAMRALGWGTVYAVTGCGILFYGIWKLSGAKNAQEFREKMGEILPKIPKNNPPQSRTEFEGLTDFLRYVSEEWNKDKKKDDK